MSEQTPSPGGAAISETRTRSGRVSKPPTRYEPVEQVEDDYAADDYDTDESDVSSTVSYDEDEEIDEEDEDEELADFVVPDKSDSDSEGTVDDGKPPVPIKKPVRRPGAAKRPVRK